MDELIVPRAESFGQNQANWIRHSSVSVATRDLALLAGGDEKVVLGGVHQTHGSGLVAATSGN